MIEGKMEITKRLKPALSSNAFWTKVLDRMDGLVGLHLAVFNEPFLGFIADGTKTIESRFSKNRIAPFERIAKGDIILLKRPGEGITGVCIVDKVWFYRLLPGTIASIRSEFGLGICAEDDKFWDDRKEASYCTLMWVSRYMGFESIPITKRDRRGWVVLR